MPKTYINGNFLFIKTDEDSSGAYYDITHMYHGKLWSYHHRFTSVAEMDEYARTH